MIKIYFIKIIQFLSDVHIKYHSEHWLSMWRRQSSFFRLLQCDNVSGRVVSKTAFVIQLTVWCVAGLQHIVSRGSDPPLIQGSALCQGSHTLCARTRDRWIKCFKNNQQDFFNKGSILSTLNVMRVFVSLNQKISWKIKQRLLLSGPSSPSCLQQSAPDGYFRDVFNSGKFYNTTEIE